MKAFRRIAEEKIQEAVERGEFNNLPNAGAAIDYQEYLTVPAHLRMMYKILKDAKYLPPELEILKQVGELKEKLEDPSLSEAKRTELTRQLRLREAEYELKMDRLRRSP